MDPMPPFTVTPVLRQAAEHRIEELEHAKEAYQNRYHLNGTRSSEGSTSNRITELLTTIETFDAELDNDDDEWTLATIKRYVEQAESDKSITEASLLRFEQQLLDRLKKHLSRMEVSSLHADLMKEAMATHNSPETTAARLDVMSMVDDFEMVEDSLEKVLEKFREDAFTPKDVHPEAIKDYLSSLIVGDEDNRYFQNVRDGMRTYGEELMDGTIEWDQNNLMGTIMDLLKSDLISPEQKQTLESYLQSPIALRELVATLNMKSFRSWTYKRTKEGLSVTARQNAEGQYHVVVKEDIVDMLFLHGLAVGWATQLNEQLKDYFDHCGHQIPMVANSELDKRSYFLEALHKLPRNVCRPAFPDAPMPPPVEELFVPYDYAPPPPPHHALVGAISRESDKRHRLDLTASVPPAPRSRLTSLYDERRKTYRRNFFMWRLPTYEGCMPKRTPRKEVQAKMIKTLIAEAKLREAFDDEPHFSATKIDFLVSMLPHKTIIEVLRYLGVPEVYLELFTRFLEARLNIAPSAPGITKQFLKRARGVPVGHGFEMFFSEALLFFLEVAVLKKTGSYLYRLHEKCFFVGNQELCKSADEEVGRFSAIMGLNLCKTHTPDKLSIGFLTINARTPASNRNTSDFHIDMALVIAHAHGIKKELDACTTTLEWVRMWNLSIGTYAAHLFGPLADVMGKRHLEAVKKAYMKIYSIIFDGSNLTRHVINMLSHVHHNQLDFPFALESLIYLPQAYGGLGVQNPFITLSLARKINEDPSAEIEKYLAAEDSYYNCAADHYALRSPSEHQQRLQAIFGGNTGKMTEAFGFNPIALPFITSIPFMSRDEFVKYREHRAYPTLCWNSPPPHHTAAPKPSVVDLYHSLLHEPVDHLNYSDKVREDVRRLSGSSCVSGDMQPWRKLSGEDRWVLQMYSDECFERYGTVEIWWPEGVPVEVYKALRGHAWDYGDDDNSDITEV